MKSPRAAIKQSFQLGILYDGHVWIDAMEDRNKTSHIYDEEAIVEISKKIANKYFPVIKKLYIFFKENYDE